MTIEPIDREGVRFSIATALECLAMGKYEAATDVLIELGTVLLEDDAFEERQHAIDSGCAAWFLHQ